MEKIIVVKIQPYALQQNIFIIKDGQIENYACSLNSIPETIFKLSQTYDIYKVRLQGSTDFTEKLIEEIEDKQFLKYSYNKLDIQPI